MRAVVYDRYGPPELQRLEDVDKPIPKNDEVLVRIHATTVTRTDTGLRAGKPFITRFFTGLRVHKAQSILVYGASGSIGTAGVQLAIRRNGAEDASSTPSASTRSTGVKAH
jgi:NADPH:quinone reductase-like Zn-dependent oxidoreductase